MASHKGGTGRSTTTANIAFRLAMAGKRVCVVDLDLASPTMGSVLGMHGHEAGAQVGIHDMLPKDSGTGTPLAPAKGPEEAVECCRPVVRYARKEVSRELKQADARLDLLPGKENEREVIENFRHIRDSLDPILQSLQDEYDVIFIDVRSGRDAPFYALLASGLPISWVIFYRWTPQHIHGAAALIHDLRKNGSVVKAVRMAYLSPRDFMTSSGQSPEGDQAKLNFFRNQDAAISNLRAELFEDDPTVATIRRDDVLLWREGILVNEDLFDIQTLSAGTIGDYRSLVNELLPGEAVG